jgi:hypothetical protein
VADLQTPTATHTVRFPRLRLGLLFFEPSEANVVREMVRRVSSELVPWTIVDVAPYDALLLARGPRRADPENVSLFRLSARAVRKARRPSAERMPTIALRRPLRMQHLKIVLEMATAELLPDHVERLMPHTRPFQHSVLKTGSDRRS